MKKLLLLLTSFCFLRAASGRQPLTKSLAKKVILDSSWQLCPGVAQRRLCYLDRSGKKVEVRIIKAKLKRNKLVLEAATPDNKDAFARQSVPDEMKMENTAGHEVIAGVNADFFNMKNGTPLGPVVKEHRIIKDAGKGMNCFVGVSNTGKIVMGDSLKFTKCQNQLAEALGARPRLIDNGRLLPQDTGSLSSIHHPRSAFGLIGNKTILLVTVDGRQPQISNGISLTDLAKLMYWLGADNAVNLDGGGSTTMVTKDLQTSEYKVQNSPSGKMLRPVANSWILVRTHSF